MLIINRINIALLQDYLYIFYVLHLLRFTIDHYKYLKFIIRVSSSSILTRHNDDKFLMTIKKKNPIPI